MKIKASPIDGQNQSNLSRKVGVQFNDFRLDFGLQKKIIDLVLQSKNQESINAFDQSYDFWEAKSIRFLDLDSVQLKYSEQKFSQVEFLHRHHQAAHWKWHQSMLADLIRPIIENFFKKNGLKIQQLTRVKIHLQKPGSNVVLHRDLTAGAFYLLENSLRTKQGTALLQYKMYPWVDLKDFNFYDKNEKPKNYLSLKIPLSSRPESYGVQVFQIEKQLKYTTDGYFYFLNENINHGALPVDYVRGLVFIDGLFEDSDVFKMNYSEIKTSEDLSCDL